MEENLYKLVLDNEEQTVLECYTPTEKGTEYQTERQLEEKFIASLIQQGYERVRLTGEEALITNLRTCLERLNNLTFTGSEWKSFFKENIAGGQDSKLDKIKRIQDKSPLLLTREDGSNKNIYLFDEKNKQNNRMQVLSQYTDGEEYRNRYDVTLLINGLPLVHCELKKRGVSLKDAFNQIMRYTKTSMQEKSRLFDYINIFIISNGTLTKYYSATVRPDFTTSGGKAFNNECGNYEFTSYWATADNEHITDLEDFTKTFLAKNTLLNILTRYCVLTKDGILKVMRPYQIAATEKIISKVKLASHYHNEGKTEGGGYIWHTTGSGKTLTSFKTASLLSCMKEIDKVLFIVDRKDLDAQTQEEYDRFQKGAANGNTSVAILKRQLEDINARIIITTIQKLGIFVKKYKTHPIYGSHVVLIFDECHRSQFGALHSSISKAFSKYHIIGFTGTPIFAPNAKEKGSLRTTAQVFGGEPDSDGHLTKPLHTYNIIDAIRDGNVLPFHITYLSTMHEKGGIIDKEVYDINRTEALLNPKRIENNVKYILDNYATQTKRDKASKDGNFNSILCTSSIPMARAYYKELKKQQEERGEGYSPLVVAMIYSKAPENEETEGGKEEEEGLINEENSDDASGLNTADTLALQEAIEDFNKTFSTSHSLTSGHFSLYYQDISRRVKNREVDILIVVNMFLTGFDAKTLNTIWIDKNLKYHSLLQAYSRTNRILNSIKTYGNVVCFRPLQEDTNEAIALYGDKEAKGYVVLRSFNDYYNGYTDADGKRHKGYKELVERLKKEFNLEEFTNTVDTPKKKKEFIKLYNEILKIKNILDAFEEFNKDDKKHLLSIQDHQNYKSNYLNIKEEIESKKEKESIYNDLEFEMLLIAQDTLTIDRILELINEYKKTHDNAIIVNINAAVSGSPMLRNKKDLIEEFIGIVSNTPNIDVEESWKKHVDKCKEQDLIRLIKEERLKEKEARKFITKALLEHSLETQGLEIEAILPNLSYFSKGESNRLIVKKRVINKLFLYFERYSDI